MERIKRLHAAHAKAKSRADAYADKRAMEIAREVDAGERGVESAIARELGISQPAVSQAAKKGRRLLAELAKKAAGEKPAAVA